MLSQYMQVCDKQNQCNHEALEIAFNVMFIYVIVLNYLGRIQKDFTLYNCLEILKLHVYRYNCTNILL